MTRAGLTPTLHFSSIDDVTAVVRNAGGRLSTARKLLLQRLFDADGPVTAEAMATALQLDLSSVYRNLEHLESLGVVRHVHLGHGPGLYALVGTGTPEYLVCERCDRVTIAAPERLEAARASIRAEFGFEAAFSHFPILGICADCRAANGDELPQR